ncbi:hypothetical protein ARC78_10180 [Stenotrophomonas pictorum JCM 9942]|uniref:General secretion pathway protein GspN n=1 Tax=Stenotrophomonas pictorum JCM 9942 TaxID=1236960 RepID=A0A0R0ALM4_9GAMM|nr:hypothetical protein [Stenotrophomonas pictorum]KRG42039.1 hypothetical protein ARC78_10180 [Stenotrophomonas pictorum JCM 9942]
MRPDVAGLRTWWLATLAAWALLGWIATLCGLGSRLPGPADDRGAPALPRIPAPAPDRLGPAGDYAAATSRPLFAPDRQPHPFVLEADGQAATAVRLTGVLMAPGTALATLTTDQGQSLRLRLGGEPVAGWQLLSLAPRSAVVSGPPGTLQLQLQVFNGSGNAAADAAAAGTLPPAAPPVEAIPPAAADSDAAVPMPGAAEIRSIRERIQARRKQAQQQSNGSSGSQNP